MPFAVVKPSPESLILAGERAADDGGPSALFLGGVLLIAAVTSAAAAWMLLAQWRRDRAAHGPLVRHLGRSLGLDLAHRRLLQRVARSTGAASAAVLLVSEGCFERAATRYRASARERAGLGAIRNRVFAAERA